MPLVTVANASLGWNADATPEELLPGQWNVCQNYRSRDGYMERVKGMQPLVGTPAVTPYYVSPYASTTTRFVVYAGLQRVFVSDGTTTTEITPLTSLPAITSITFSTTTATVTFSSAHGRTTGDSLVFDGATPTIYNGTYAVTVTGATTLTYTLPGTPSGVTTVQPLAWLNVTQLLTGAIDNRYTGGTFNGTLVLNNGVDQPLYWGGDITKRLRILPGWDPAQRAAVIRPYKTHLIALDITKGVGTTPIRYPHMLKGSWAAVPGSVPSGWDPASAGQDGIERDLAETSDYMVDCYAMGDVLIVYKEANNYAVRQSYDNNIYISQRIPGSGGMLARACVAETPKGHVVLTSGDLVIHQGGAATSVAEGRLKREIFDTMDPSKKARAFVVLNPKCKEVWVCYPSRNSETCDMCVIYNYDDNTFGGRSLLNVTYGAAGLLPTTASSGRWIDLGTRRWIDQVKSWTQNEYSAAEQGLMLARSNPEISLVEVGGTDSGVLLLDGLERWALKSDNPRGDPLSDTTRVKALSIIRPRCDAIAGTTLGVSMGSSNIPNVPPSYKMPVTFRIGQQSEATTISDGGAFLAVRLSRSDVDTSPIQPQRIRSFDAEYIDLGRY